MYKSQVPFYFGGELSAVSLSSFGEIK